MLIYEELQNVLGVLEFIFLGSYCHLPDHFLIIFKHLLMGWLTSIAWKRQKKPTGEFNLRLL